MNDSKRGHLNGTTVRKIRVSSNMLRGERRYGVSKETRALPCLKEVEKLL